MIFGVLVALASAQEPPAPAPPAPAPAPAPDPQAGGANAELERAITVLADPSPTAADTAIPLLQNVLQSDPESSVARVNLGLALQRKGDLAGARREYQTVTARDAAFGPAWAYLGWTQALAGDWSAAENTWREGIRAAPGDMAVRAALANGLRDLKRSAEAVDVAKAALKVDTRSVEIYSALGNAYLDQGNLQLAKFVFQKALRDADGDGRSDLPGADESAELHSQLGWTWFQLDDPFAAEAELEKAIQLDPQLATALIYLSKLYLEQHNYAETVPLLERAVAQAPTNHGLLMNLGLAYRGVGKLAEAKATYQRAQALQPGNPDPHFNLAVLIGDYEKDYPGAIDEYRQYISGGGSERALAESYIEAVEKEQKFQEKRKKAEDDRKRREEERKRKESGKAPAPGDPPPAGEPAPAEPAPAEPAPAEPVPAEPAPTEPAPENPWGEPK